MPHPVFLQHRTDAAPHCPDKSGIAHGQHELHRMRAAPWQSPNKFGIALGLHYLYRTQAAPWQCPNKFGIALGLHYL
jgi:hypothetical protein